jgi:hypothetical protein
MLNKTSGLSYCDIRERYEHFRSRCTDDKKKEKEQNKFFNKTRKNKKEKGCTEALYGKKARCIINIVPKEQRGETLKIDSKCK